MKLRQEKQISNNQAVVSSTTPSLIDGGICLLDTASFSGSPTYYFEFAYNLLSQTTSYSIRLRRNGTSTDDCTVTSGLTQDTTWRVTRVAFTPPAGQTEYQAAASSDGTNTSQFKNPRIIIVQNETAITKTETEIEIGNREVNKTNTAASLLAAPRYWQWNSASWDGVLSFFADVVWTTSAKNTTTINVCKDDITNNETIVNAGTNSTGYVRTRAQLAAPASSFLQTEGGKCAIRCLGSTTKSGYNIGRAAIIVRQTPGVGLKNATASTVSLQGGSAAENNQMLAHDFVPQTDMTTASVTFMAAKSGTPTDNLVVDIMSGGAAGTSLGSASIAGGTITTSAAEYTLTLTGVSLTAGTSYTLRFSRSGANSTSNYFLLYKQTTFGTNTYHVRNAGSWNNSNGTNYYAVNAATGGGITKCEPQYVLLNSSDSNVTGVPQNHPTIYDSTDWDAGDGTITLTHAMDSDNASNSAKIRDLTAGADVTNSTVTGTGQVESSAITLTSGNLLDTYGVNSTGTICGCRILVAYSFVAPAVPIIPDIIQQPLTPPHYSPFWQ